MPSLPIDAELDAAIRMLAAAMPAAETMLKPVLLHSIRIGTLFHVRGYKREICLAAVLHDALEDTTITFERIKEAFGAEVARLVAANTKNTDITDTMERYEEILRRCAEAGEDAAIIKAADILDNYTYFARIHNAERVAFFTGTSKMFLSFTSAFTDSIFAELRAGIFGDSSS